MMKKAITLTKVLIIIFSVSILLATPVMAPPFVPPHAFYGNVLVDGSPAVDGLTVTAAIAGVTFPYSVTTSTANGKYGYDFPFFKVPADDPENELVKDGGVDGDVIIFYVDGIVAGSYSFEMGQVTNLNLSVTKPSPPAGNLVNPGFETGDLSGWTVQQVTDFVGVVTADEFASPYTGNYMLRLGTPRYSEQPIGNDIVYQDFLAVEPTLSFVYNIFTYDYIGYNHFHYLVTDLTTGTIITDYSQGAWGSGTSLKSTGWQVVMVDLSAHLGHNIRLEIASGGTLDNLYALWTYVDSPTFGVNIYGIIATAGANGSISPAGAVAVNYGDNQTFTITPSTGYHIADVLVDNSSVGSVATYTFTNVTANHTIAASFAIDTFTITATAGANGSISPAGAVTVNYGASQTFIITPSTGYHIATLTVDGSPVTPVSSYTFPNVTANHTIAASFIAANKIGAGFSTHWEYSPTGDNFTNNQVTGYKNWHADLSNLDDASGQAVTGLELSLNSNLAFDQIYPAPQQMGPPTYQWSFGDVPQGSGANIVVGSKSPDKFPVTFTPGFDASRSVSQTVFTAPAIQTLTVTLTPRQNTEGLSIHIRTREDALVNAVITSPTSDESIYLSPDGRLLRIRPAGLVLNTPRTITVTIQVTPKVARVEYTPFVIIWQAEKLAYGTVSGSSVSRPAGDLLDGVGTWAWSAQGSYKWDWGETLRRAVVWNMHSRDGDWIKNPANGHYYKLTTSMGWLQAESQAVEWAGHLVTINDREEELWLRGQFGADEYFWIGFNDIAVEGNWKWASGEPATYTNWASGEPNNYNNEDAAVMNWAYGSTFGDGWNDIPIDGHIRGIVETAQPPFALFTYSPEQPKVNQKVTFNASSSYDPDGTIVSYQWQFGDGGTATGTIVEHSYSNPGDYTVILTVTDNDGVIDAKAKVVTVAQPPPSAPRAGRRSLPDPSTLAMAGSGLAAGLFYIGLSRLRRRLSRS